MDAWSRRADVWAIDKSVELFDFWTAGVSEPIAIGHLGTFDETDASHAMFTSLDS